MVLSPTTVVLFWSDTTILSGQANSNRQYQVRYKSINSSKYKFANSTQLNCMLDDLRPFTQYEFAVKVRPALPGSKRVGTLRKYVGKSARSRRKVPCPKKMSLTRFSA